MNRENTEVAEKKDRLSRSFNLRSQRAPRFTLCQAQSWVAGVPRPLDGQCNRLERPRRVREEAEINVAIGVVLAVLADGVQNGFARGVAQRAEQALGELDPTLVEGAVLVE